MNDNWSTNASANISGMLTPYGSSFSYGAGPDDAAAGPQATSWQAAASNNGAGPVALNNSAPWSFNDFITGRRPLLATNNVGSPTVAGVQWWWWIVAIAVVYYLFFKRSR